MFFASFLQTQINPEFVAVHEIHLHEHYLWTDWWREKAVKCCGAFSLRVHPMNDKHGPSIFYNIVSYEHVLLMISCMHVILTVANCCKNMLNLSSLMLTISLIGLLLLHLASISIIMKKQILHELEQHQIKLWLLKL